MKLPILFLRLEGAVILVVCLIVYLLQGYELIWFIVLFFSFDISILGYVINPKAGALTYNSIHSFIGPAILVLIGLSIGSPICIGYSLIWFAHLGFDRMIGFGFMYPDRFGRSNLADKRLPTFVQKRLS